jgi:SAM-dependent methyltransferase
MPTQEQNLGNAASFFDVLFRTLGTRPRRILDFGCGEGALARDLRTRGYDAYGCDTWKLYKLKPPTDERLREISQDPYRIPFEDEFFDAVVSTSVFEHAQNKEECFREIHRVLKKGGHSVHMFPGKLYLPWEPHIYVPFVNWFWPKVPKWWLGIFAFLGVRNEYQHGKAWREVRDHNYWYCANGISYWSWKRYREMSERIFGKCEYPMELFISQPGGGFNRLAQKLPFKPLSGLVSRHFRSGVLLQTKVHDLPMAMKSST